MERDGTHLAFQVWGEGELDLVLVPGVFSHLELSWGDPAWSRFAAALGSFARVVTYDKRGTGMSGPLTQVPPPIERMHDLLAVMDAAGVVRPAAVLGISDGAALAAMLAALRPERVQALCLYAVNPGGPWAPDRPWGIRDDVWQRLDAAVDAWGSGSTLSLFAPSIATDVQRRLWAFVERASVAPDVLRVMLRANRRSDIEQALPLIRTPTLVLHRREDLMPVEGGRRVAALIPGARYVELEGVDHLPWIADSAPLYDAVAEFLTAARAGPGAGAVTATLLFTDIVGSTERVVAEGDIAWRQRLTAHDEVVRDGIARFGGRELDHTGDGFLAAFSDPVQAAACARGVVTRVQGVGVAVRAGLHTGECQVDGLSLRGLAVHLAARVVAQAGPGQVLASLPSALLLQAAQVPTSSCGTFALKGFPGEVELFEIGEPEQASPPAVPLVPPATTGADRLQVRLISRVPALARASLRLTRPAAGR